jgi:spore cortex biosynthesis protein YabQ
MFASGALLGVFLDIYRVLSTRFTLRGWPIPIIDLLFWMLSACFVFGVLLWSNWGEMRFYIMLAIIAGILFYLLLLTRPVTRFLMVLLQTVEWLIKTLIRLGEVLLYRPMVHLIRFLWRIISRVVLIIWIILTKPILWVMNPINTFCRPYVTKWKKSWSIRKKGGDDEDLE